MSKQFIDITPVGMQTPEGIARVNEAIEAQNESILTCANLLQSMHDEFRFGQLNEVQFELLKEVGEALTQRRAASEAFLSAIAGR